ncbi:M56 family metallopeptidase [Telluria sp. B2]
MPPLLLRAALFSSLAVLVLLAARTLLRRWFGASLAYLAWLIVPVVTLAALLERVVSPQR